LAGLGVLVLACWAWIVPMGRDMYGSMTGPSAWMMTTRWDAPHLLLLFAMWTAMMIGMMLPSAAPALLLYALVVRRGPDVDHAAARVNSFAAGYLAIWVLFSLVATLLQRFLAGTLLLSPMMELRSPVSSGVLLIIAGTYQLTPMKRTCLDSCRSPAAFISSHWRTDNAGAFRMGIDHGLVCLGCCWALMLLLFAGGVMNLFTIGALTLFVLVEKVARFGVQGGRLSGLLLIAAGFWLIVSRYTGH
jgi:predicted metal-binding membrane protein